MRVLLYGDQNLNALDGSSIWLVSMAQALAGASLQVDLLLKSPILSTVLTGDLADNPLIRLIDPGLAGRSEDGYSPAQAAARIRQLDQEPYDLIIVRGFQAALEVARTGQFTNRLIPYLTDLPEYSELPFSDKHSQGNEIIAESIRLFAQTEDARAVLEHSFPGACGKTLLLPPMIPPHAAAGRGAAGAGREGLPDAKLNLIYAGKFAPLWNTLEMCQLPALLAAKGIDAELLMVGDKILRDPTDPQYVRRMREALESSPGVTWVGKKTRTQTLDLMAQADIGLGWRSSALDGSSEISTKLLEYLSVGTMPVVNRTRAHEKLLGSDYPLFADSANALDAIAQAGQVLESPAWPLPDISAYTLAGASERLSQQLLPLRFLNKPADSQALRLLVAGHDFKFLGEIVDRLQASRHVELRFDKWESLHSHDADASSALLAWAQSIWCEWAGPNAVWYSTHKRPEQKLFIRLHMFELDAPWLQKINGAAVDKLICVSNFVALRAQKILGLNDSQVAVIPNVVDATDLFREKLDCAPYQIGIVGTTPYLTKRVDRALDLLQLLRAQDPRFILHIRGRLPSEYPWEWKKDHERIPAQEQYQRIISDPDLVGAVSLEGFGGDMGTWLRGIGWLLSPSSRESFHLAPVEGAASGSVPIVWNRPGATDVFGESYVVEDTPEAASRILQVMSRGAWGTESAAASAWAAKYDIGTIAGDVTRKLGIGL